MTRQPPRIIVVADLLRTAGRDIFYGISRFIQMHPEWSVMFFSDPHSITAERFEALERQGYDGMILATSGVFNERLSQRLLKSDKPTVCLGDPGMLSQRKNNISFLRIDNEAIGVAGAQYLVSLGNWRSYGFIPLPDPRMYWSAARMAGFTSEIRRTGHDCMVFRSIHEMRTEADASALREWIVGLPKPCAIMAATDMRASQVVETCRECDLSIPSQVAILGVDNDVALCDFMRPSLSSILPNHEGAGFAGAKALEALLTGGRKTARTIPPLPPLRIVERETTATATPAAHLITRAMEFIQRNSTRNLKVGDVVRYLGVSRRLASLRFREFNDKTILETITECRLAEVCGKLTSTNQKIAAISRECGFSNITYLKTLFRRHFGMTMKEWRRRAG